MKPEWHWEWDKRFRRAESCLRRLPQVLGVGFGVKETAGQSSQIPAWRVYVRRKLPPHMLPAKARVPSVWGGLATDVIKASGGLPMVALDAATPVYPGDCVSNLRGVLHGTTVEPPLTGLGTLGFFAAVNGQRQREIVMVSNRHVLLAYGAGRGDPIYRPTVTAWGETCHIQNEGLAPVAEILDEGTEENHEFAYADEPRRSYFVDAATAKMTVRQDGTQNLRFPAEHMGKETLVRGIARLYPLDVVGRRSPRVHKIGAGTGLTVGRVVDAAATVRSAGGIRSFNLAIRGENGCFVGPGDSGALVINDRGQAVGLLWGRSEHDPALAYACHIHPLLHRLGVTMMTGGTA